MATVFKAYHPALDRYVAIKVLHPAFTQVPGFLMRFQREARIVARLDHPHIVPIYDCAEHRGHSYLVMRFIEGETLKARIQRGPLKPADILGITRAVGWALSYAHEQGVLHRDIKPSNILLSPDGGVYLTDFGVARMVEAGESTVSRDGLTGTPQYISPEQGQGLAGLDARTDIYSLGVVLYELLVGQVPFTADTPYAIIHSHIYTPLPLPRSLNPNLSEPVERMLLKALAKEREDRFQTVEALVTALETALRIPPAPSLPETVVAMPPTMVLPPETVVSSKGERVPPTEKEKRKEKKKRRLWPWLAAGAALAIILVLAIAGVAAVDQLRQSGAFPQTESAEQLLESARDAWDEQDHDRALALYQQAVAADPHLIPAYLEGHELLVRTEDRERAMGFLLEGLQANPDEPALHERLAEVALLSRQWEVAQREVEWLLQEMPEHALPHAYAALLTLGQGARCEEALPELDTALRVDPDLAWAHYGLALCHIQEDNPQEARAELEFVLGQDELAPGLRVRAEQMLERLAPGEGEAVGREFQALLRLAEDIPEEGDLRASFSGMLDHARGAWEAGRKEEAIEILRRARGWVEEHWASLGDPLAEELSSRLDRIILLIAAP